MTIKHQTEEQAAMCRPIALDALYVEADQLAGKILAAEDRITALGRDLAALRAAETRLARLIRRRERRLGGIALRGAVPIVSAHVR